MTTQQIPSWIEYEFRMFEYLAEQVDEANVGSGYSEHDDAMLESFLLHTRLLRDFFCNETKQHPNDALARDYINDWDFTESEYLRSLRIPLNRLLAHLSTERENYTVQAYFWQPEQICGEICPMIEDFRTRCGSPAGDGQ